MRNVIVHQYFGILPEVVWDVVPMNCLTLRSQAWPDCDSVTARSSPTLRDRIKERTVLLGFIAFPLSAGTRSTPNAEDQSSLPLAAWGVATDRQAMMLPTEVGARRVCCPRPHGTHPSVWSSHFQ